MELNRTQLTEFVLRGITDRSELQVPLFLVFFLIYVITMVGNLGLIFVIWKDPHLHTPMYFFLSNLSISDMGFCSTTAPKMLSYLSGQGGGISFQGCVVQHFFYHCLGCTECFLYTVHETFTSVECIPVYCVYKCRSLH